MIAMQYSFVLPADYDMSVIERRIAENGARLDGFPGLVFKTYLYARRDDPTAPSRENLYAPLYLWQDAPSMARFLASAGFAALTQAFGRPRVQSWLVARAPQAGQVKPCTLARREIAPLTPETDLSAIGAASEGDLLGWDSGDWRQLRVDFLQRRPAADADETSAQYYRIGYVATGDTPNKRR
ncbi:DUF4865 family protein [Affinibrenneria salicis]|uniref:DUF4865 family protein n=1 Tax=Affinibrenneria salicis TaxID=2590031 RepID=A0A5J5FU00_9GAMM|nr:DUF4865 family protein [Affinibrenneria salicis]KAA8996924.1 DUF4865 family protein [Affinibrenneria salicis]